MGVNAEMPSDVAVRGTGVGGVDDAGIQSDRHDAFYRLLRRRIVSGAWKRGDRIPNRLDLIREFDTSLATMQKALDRLKEEGFVRPRGRAGTFVQERLPGQYQVALATGLATTLATGGATPGVVSSMWRAMQLEVDRINEGGRWRVRVYAGLNDPRSPELTRLAEDVANDCCAGVFVVGMAARRLQEAGALGRAGQRVLALTGDAAELGLPRVDLLPYLGRALDYAVAHGRQRIGVVNSLLQRTDLEGWEQALATRGLAFDPYRAVNALPTDSGAVRVAVYHMMRQTAEHRPDALLVTDDHMVEPVTAAIRDAGVAAPDDVLVIGHCNYPLPPTHHVPVTFIGFDLAEVLDRVVARIAPNPDGPRGRVTPVTGMTFEARFEHELPDERRRRHKVTPAHLPRIDLTPLRRDYMTASAYGS